MFRPYEWTECSSIASVQFSDEGTWLNACGEHLAEYLEGHQLTTTTKPLTILMNNAEVAILKDHLASLQDITEKCITVKQVEKDKQVQLLMQQVERMQDKYVEAIAEIRASAETVAEHIQQFIAHRRLPCEAPDSIAATLAELKLKSFLLLSLFRKLDRRLSPRDKRPT